MTAPEMTFEEACGLLRQKAANLDTAGWGGSFEATAIRTVLEAVADGYWEADTRRTAWKSERRRWVGPWQEIP